MYVYIYICICAYTYTTSPIQGLTVNFRRFASTHDAPHGERERERKESRSLRATEKPRRDLVAPTRKSCPRAIDGTDRRGQSEATSGASGEPLRRPVSPRRVTVRFRAIPLSPPSLSRNASWVDARRKIHNYSDERVASPSNLTLDRRSRTRIEGESTREGDPDARSSRVSSDVSSSHP